MTSVSVAVRLRFLAEEMVKSRSRIESICSYADSSVAVSRTCLQYNGEYVYARITLWSTRYAIRLVMHMNAIEIILSRKIVFFIEPEIDDERSATSDIERIREAMEIPRSVSAFRLIDLICDAMTSISSLEIETTSSLEASLRNELYLFPKVGIRFLFATAFFSY